MKITFAPRVFAKNAKSSTPSLFGKGNFDPWPRPSRLIELAAPKDFDVYVVGTNVVGGRRDNLLIPDRDDTTRALHGVPHERQPPPKLLSSFFCRVVVPFFSITFG